MTSKSSWEIVGCLFSRFGSVLIYKTHIFVVAIRFIGLSSTGITYKSSSPSFGSNYSSGERYGSFSGTREADSFGDSYRDNEPVKTSTSKTGSQKSGSKSRKDAKPDRR